MCFCKEWGPGMYLNAAWPTRDHIIPWTLYRLLTDPDLLDAVGNAEL